MKYCHNQCTHCINMPQKTTRVKYIYDKPTISTTSAHTASTCPVRLLYSQTCQPSRFWRDSPAFLPDVPRPAKNYGNVPLFVRSRIFFARAQFVTLPRCPDVNANHPIERNYGNSVRFLAKIPNGTAAESPCYSVFWNAIDFCRLYTSKKNLNLGPANRPTFCRQVLLFYAKFPSKNILQVGRSVLG